MKRDFWSSIKTNLKAAFGKQDLNFEGKWLVSVDELQITCQRPNGVIESVSWKDLKLIAIETTDEGPYVPDVFWYLVGEESGCLVAMGATGEKDMIEKLQQLPDFDNEALVEAMTCTSNRKFVCWQRSGAT
jgi:hypothetical protein